MFHRWTRRLYECDQKRLISRATVPTFYNYKYFCSQLHDFQGSWMHLSEPCPHSTLRQLISSHPLIKFQTRKRLEELRYSQSFLPPPLLPPLVYPILGDTVIGASPDSAEGRRNNCYVMSWQPNYSNIGDYYYDSEQLEEQRSIFIDGRNIWPGNWHKHEYSLIENYENTLQFWGY
jgi:hypothetical protein